MNPAPCLSLSSSLSTIFFPFTQDCTPFKAESCSVAYPQHIFFSHLLNEHYGCFHSLHIVNSATVIMGEQTPIANSVHILFSQLFSSSLALEQLHVPNNSDVCGSLNLPLVICSDHFEYCETFNRFFRRPVFFFFRCI